MALQATGAHVVTALQLCDEPKPGLILFQTCCAKWIKASRAFWKLNHHLSTIRFIIGIVCSCSFESIGECATIDAAIIRSRVNGLPARIHGATEV